VVRYGIDTHARPVGRKRAEGTVRPGADREAFREIVAEAGPCLLPWFPTPRLVHLPEPTERGAPILLRGEGPDPRRRASLEDTFDDVVLRMIEDMDALADIAPRGPAGAEGAEWRRTAIRRTSPCLPSGPHAFLSPSRRPP
jgi:hypothetical protein